MGLLGSMGHRYAFRQPMNARIHSTIFCTVSMFWAGYQWHKYRSMLELGDFKYAVEFAERHSVRYSICSPFTSNGQNNQTGHHQQTKTGHVRRSANTGALENELLGRQLNCYRFTKNLFITVEYKFAKASV